MGSVVPREVLLLVTLGRHFTAENDKGQEWNVLGSATAHNLVLVLMTLLNGCFDVLAT